MLPAYLDHVAERAALGIPPLPLTAVQTGQVIELIKSAMSPDSKDGEFLLDLLTYRVPAGVDDAAKVKASYLAAVAHGTEKTVLLSRERVAGLLGPLRALPGARPLGLRSERWVHEHLFSRAASIYGGSAQIQRTIVSERLLGLPRG